MATAQLTIIVDPMTVSTGTLPVGLVGKSYSASLQTNGGKPTLVWSIASGSLPAGLKLATTGSITGTPTTPGTSTFTVSVHDASKPAQVATRALSLIIAPMTVATTSLPIAKVKSLYTTSLKTSGGKATFTWSVVSGALPPGLKLASNGTISGTPTVAGTYNFTVMVTDGSVPKNAASQALSIIVNP